MKKIITSLLSVLAITSIAQVQLKVIEVGDLALLNGVDPILNLEHKEGVLPEPETTSAADYVSYDLFVSPASGFDINYPWDNGDESYIGGYGDSLTFDLTGADDGEYDGADDGADEDGPAPSKPKSKKKT